MKVKESRFLVFGTLAGMLFIMVSCSEQPKQENEIGVVYDQNAPTWQLQSPVDGSLGVDNDLLIEAWVNLRDRGGVLNRPLSDSVTLSKIDVSPAQNIPLEGEIAGEGELADLYQIWPSEGPLPDGDYQLELKSYSTSEIEVVSNFSTNGTPQPGDPPFPQMVKFEFEDSETYGVDLAVFFNKEVRLNPHQAVTLPGNASLPMYLDELTNLRVLYITFDGTMTTESDFEFSLDTSLIVRGVDEKRWRSRSVEQGRS